MTHDELVARAETWLRSIGCGLTFRELVTATHGGEIPDAIGWRSGVSILIECKTSRSDFRAERRKRFRSVPGLGMGDWRFYLCRPGVLKAEDMPEGWGLLYALERGVQRVHGAPKGNAGWGYPPHAGHKRNEMTMMYSALRRLSLRGYLPSIYDPAPTSKPSTQPEAASISQLC